MISGQMAEIPSQEIPQKHLRHGKKLRALVKRFKNRMDIGIIYLAVAFILLVLSAVKDTKKTKQALKATGKIALSA